MVAVQVSTKNKIYILIYISKISKNEGLRAGENGN